jgi:hypothetical protein
VVNLQFTATGGGGNGATNSFFVNMYLPNNNTPRPFVNGVPNNGPYPIILSGEASWCTLTSYNIGCAPTSEAGLQALVNRGYIVAEFGRDNFSLDYSGDGGTAVFNSSIYMLYPYDSHGVTGYDWGNLLAWAWGYSRVIDYFETLSYVDKNRIAVIGMSRGAEASCVAGMYDTRIALTVAIQSCPTFERYTGGGVDTADFGSITGTGGAPGWYSAFISRFAGCYTTCPKSASIRLPIGASHHRTTRTLDGV